MGLRRGLLLYLFGDDEISSLFKPVNHYSSDLNDQLQSGLASRVMDNNTLHRACLSRETSGLET